MSAVYFLSLLLPCHGKRIRLFFNTTTEKLRLGDQNCQGGQWFNIAAMFCVRTKLAFN